MTDETKATLDDAMRAELADMLEDDEVITCWIAVAGVRRLRGGGTIVTTSSGLASENGPAVWEVEGLLRRGLAVLNDPNGNEED